MTTKKGEIVIRIFKIGTINITKHSSILRDILYNKLKEGNAEKRIKDVLPKQVTKKILLRVILL